MSSEMIKPTKEQFEDYVRIQKSGVTNMFDSTRVCTLSDTGLTRPILYYIMHGNNYDDLAKEYGVNVDG